VAAGQSVTEDLLLRPAQLGDLGSLVGEGGQAKVYEVKRLSLVDAPGPLVVKLYRSGHAPPRGLRALVAKRNRLDPEAMARLDSFAAWPLRVVEDRGAVCGVVLPLIPSSFFQTRVLPGTGQRVRGPREVQNLFVDPARARFVGMPEPTFAQRLLVCRDFASALHLLHKHEMVVGDINAKNALFRLRDRPSVMLVDCDAIRIKGSMPVVRQLNAPDWEPPEGSVLSQATDLYKFGLFVLRCLGPGQDVSTARDPRRADAALGVEGRNLLRAALSVRPADRPAARDWGRYLDRRVAAALRPKSSVLRAPPEGTAPGWRRDPASGAWRAVR
jgi:hypothetical protein